MRKALATIAGLAALTAAFEGDTYSGVGSPYPNDRAQPPIGNCHKRRAGQFKPKQFKKRKARSKNH